MKKHIYYEDVLFLLAFCVGLFLRLYKIETVPYGLNHDGAWAAIWAHELSIKPLPIQIFSDQGWLGEAMPRYVMAIFVNFFGPTVFAAKMGMMIFTIFALPCMYLLAKELFHNSRVAFFATFLLAASGWDITYGKSGWAVSSVPLFVIVSTLFLIKAVKSGAWRMFAWAGFFTGLSFHTYRGGPMIVPTIGIVTWYLYTTRKQLWPTVSRIVLFVGCFLLIAGPLIWYAVHHWDNYIGRVRFLSVHNRILQTGSLTPVWENFRAAARMYTIEGQFGADFYLKEPLLDFPTDWLFIAGILTCVWYIRRKPYALTLFLFLASALPVILGGPDGSHGIGTLPVVYLFAGIGLETVYIMTKRLTVLRPLFLPQLIAGILICYAAVHTFDRYLSPRRHIRWGFYPETTVVAYYMKPRIPSYDIYLTDNFPRNTLTYLTYQGGDPWKKHYTWLENGSDFLTTVPKPNKGLIFIMAPFEEHRPLLHALQEKYPSGVFSVLPFHDDSITITAAWIFTVDHPDTILFLPYEQR